MVNCKEKQREDCEILDLPGKDVSNSAPEINNNYDMRDGRNCQS